MENKYSIHNGADPDKKYGLPELKKYPMPDADHVRSAIKFFNYVEPQNEEELAKAIFERMKEYGLTFDDFSVGENNRFLKYIPKNVSLSHHGILGQKWGHTNGPPYPLNPADYSLSEKRAMKKDLKWIARNERKIQNKAYRKSKRDLKKYSRALDKKYRRKKNGNLSADFINSFNRAMADLMNEKVSNITSPSGRAVKFVAKRGEIGVYTALADQGYDMNAVRNGVWDSGRIAYKQIGVNKISV